MENNLIEKEYLNDLKQIKETIRTNQNKAMVVVNSAMISTYYEIGTIINQRKQWGNKYIERLSNDLKEYGSGFSRTNLFYMRKIASIFTKDEIVQRAVGQIPWRSLICIINKCKKYDEIIWYVEQTYRNSWTKTIIENKIKMKAYELRLIEKYDNSLLSNENVIMDEIFNSKIVIDFIDRNKINTEKDLEEKLIHNITKFILELGKGFAYIGNQYRLEISNREYYPDLLFYNYIIHSFVIVDLKLTEFKPEYLGKMMFYINIVNETLKGKNDNPTVGIILCKEADTIIMKYSFGDIKTPVKIAEYKFIEELPKYLEKRLRVLK